MDVPSSPGLDPITTRDDLIRSLRATAELEHAVMCQYLFAAYTMKRDAAEGGVSCVQLERMRAWQATLLLVARQEMEHLGLVCNLLTAVGGMPHFGRPRALPSSSSRSTAECLTLAPFSLEAVERFMAIEKGHAVLSEDDACGTGPTIGAAYHRIRSGFERLNESNNCLFIGPASNQVVNATIDLQPGKYDIRLRPVFDLESAQQTIDQIMEMSDGPPEENPDSHYMRFKRVYEELRTIQFEDPAFAPARLVCVNPSTRPPLDGQHDITPIEHPVTRRAAMLFNEAYETMLLMLARFYAPGDDEPEDRTGLKKIVFFPMMTMILRPLGEILTRMPVHPARQEVNAGPTFEFDVSAPLHSHRGSAWTRVHERLQRLVSSSSELLAALDAEIDPWTAVVRPRLTFLHENLLLTVSNFTRYMKVNELRQRHLLGRMLGKQ